MTTLEAISTLLKHKNKSQKELTIYLNLSKSVFTDWRSGKSESYKKHLPRIAEFLEVDVNVLLDPDNHIFASDDNSIEVITSSKGVDVKQNMTEEEYDYLFLKYNLLNDEQKKLIFKFIDMLLQEDDK